MTTPADSDQPAPRMFQFRIATLLVAMVWVGVVCVSFRTPTPLWSGVISVAGLLAILVAIIVATYGSGRARATALGFLVFSLGYAAHLVYVTNNEISGFKSESAPTGALLRAAFERMHAGQAEFLGLGGNDGSRAYAAYRRFNLIGHHAFASLFGVVGAILAQILYARQRRDATPTDR